MDKESRKILWKNRRIRVPSVLQMEMTECGAASLSMVMRYYKLFLPLEKLRIDCGVSRDGSNAMNMVRAARSHGFEARGFKHEPDELNMLKLPLILHWNFNHFVVLEGRRGKNFYINDPAGGRRRVDYDEFDRSFTGLALEIKPGENFKPEGRRESLLASLFSRMKNVKTAVFYIFLCSVLLAVPGIIIPTASRIFVDDVLGSNHDWLLPLIVALFLTMLVRSYIVWLQRTAILKLSIKFIVSTASGLFHHILRMPPEFYYQRSPGDLQYRISLNRDIADMLSGDAGEVFASFFMVFFYLIVMFQYDVPLALVGVIIAFLNIIALRMVNRRRQDLNEGCIQAKCKMIGTFVSGIQMIETIKASASDFDFFSKWAGHQAKSINAERKMSVSSVYISALPELLSGLNNAVILVFGAWRVINGDMTMGMLVAFQVLMGGFLGPVATLTGIGAKIQEAKGAVDKINDILNYEKAPVFRETGEHLPKDDKIFLEGRLEMKNITFGYAPLSEPLIKDFSLLLKPGGRIAVVGRSGSGKSTVAKIAAGLYKPWEGEVLLDGKPAGAYSRQCLERSLAIVDQDIAMFSGTIRENLSMWNPLAPDNDMIKAAMDSDIHLEIAERPGGYGAECIEDGRNFSGGQRQRMEIARSLFNSPSILILDEATSSLDPETEKIIDDNLRRRGCSCLIVAHRLSTIRDCDEIIVMDAGNIVQRGTHEQLMSFSDGFYARLINSEQS
ncbi:MAG: NHLP family bacteriocin export ABC transporter peptidase/permease/ATPase subunit [Lentisphaerae bacterium GWF2_44_16]|nr:MAG: NHLP family bacteriocin export ABC transporter peptidase/permease/ATPase subunit [Lentisphaerae bacterium GWF2_44_16]